MFFFLSFGVLLTDQFKLSGRKEEEKLWRRHSRQRLNPLGKEGKEKERERDLNSKEAPANFSFSLFLSLSFSLSLKERKLGEKNCLCEVNFLTPTDTQEFFKLSSFFKNDDKKNLATPQLSRDFLGGKGMLFLLHFSASRKTLVLRVLLHATIRREEELEKFALRQKKSLQHPNFSSSSSSHHIGAKKTPSLLH